MTAQQHFWALIYAWSHGLVFVLIVLVVVLISYGVYYDKLSNPFGPFIRWVDRWQQHHYEISKLKLRAALARQGMDPDYVKELEKKNDM